MINKFYNNRIALLILSLFLSILMFVYVKAEQYSENPVSFFQNVSEATTETILLAVAVQFASARLIDNLLYTRGA